LSEQRTSMIKKEHIYYIKSSQRMGYIFFGISSVALLFCTFATNFQSIFTGKLGIMDYLGLLGLLFLFLPFGIILMASAFTKIILHANGIEYHTPVFILKAKWDQLENLGYHYQAFSGKSLLIAPVGGEVILKSWAKPVKGILRHKVEDIFIFTSSFQDNENNSLQTDMVSFLPNKSPEIK